VQILAITTARDASIAGDLDAAEELLTQEIHTDPNNYTSYAHRSFIMSRKHAWDPALEDAIKVSYTDPPWPSDSIIAFICDTVHRHSVLTDRLYLQGHRPLRKRPRQGGKDSVRCRIHVHRPRSENQPFSYLDQGIFNLSHIFSVSLRVSGHCPLQRRATRGSNAAHQRASCRLSEY